MSAPVGRTLEGGGGGIGDPNPRPKAAGVFPTGHPEISVSGRKRLWQRLAGEGGGKQGCSRKEGTSKAAPEAVGQAVGGVCQSGWGAVTVGYKCH